MKLLIVGQINSQLIVASKLAKKNGAQVNIASDIKSALCYLRQGKSADIIMIDINQNLKEFFDSVKTERMVVNVIVCGIEASEEQVLKAIKLGAKEYIPLPPQEDLIAAVFEAISGINQCSAIIGNSEKFTEILAITKQIAPTEANLLITGESGTGKEVIAKFVHRNSKRAKHEFVSINCAAIPENLLESELFGHEKGAFTGAIDRRIGKFEQADNSTILLDEVSEMGLHLQAKLLRAIQEKEIVRVGGQSTIKLNIRFIATSNRNLLDEVKKGNFREDLFYRLNVLNINIPGLDARLDDIEPLAYFFIKKYAKLNGVDEKPLTPEAIEKLKDYKWPGNVRELENTIHRSLLLATGKTITAKDIILTNETFIEKDETLENIEKIAIEKTLQKYKGDEIKAAMVLGISINTLKSKLMNYRFTA